MTFRIVVIGVGNPHRGDDAAGREAARRLRETCANKAEIVDIDGEATQALAALERADAAFLIDACVSGAPAGTVRRIDLNLENAPASIGASSSHGFGLAQALELAAALDVAPRCCVLYAIEAASFDIGAPMSPPVALAVDEVVRRLHEEIDALALSAGANRAAAPPQTPA